jgi:uncharacterized membrane protein YgcG
VKTLREFHASSSISIAVLIVPSLDGQPIFDYSMGVWEQWKIGKAKKNDGVLLLVAPNERKVRIATGYDNEGALPDITCKHIITDVITPTFRSGDQAGAVVAGVNAIIAELAKQATSATVPSAAPVPQAQGGYALLVIGIVVILCLVVLGVLLGWFRRSSRSSYASDDGAYCPPTRPYDDGYTSRSTTPAWTAPAVDTADDDDDDDDVASVLGAVAAAVSDDDDDDGPCGGGDTGGGGADGDL